MLTSWQRVTGVLCLHSAQPAVGVACRAGPCSVCWGDSQPRIAFCTRNQRPPWPATPISALLRRREVSARAPLLDLEFQVVMSNFWRSPLEGARRWGAGWSTLELGPCVCNSLFFFSPPLLYNEIVMMLSMPLSSHPRRDRAICDVSVLSKA